MVHFRNQKEAKVARAWYPGGRGTPDQDREVDRSQIMQGHHSGKELGFS